MAVLIQSEKTVVEPKVVLQSFSLKRHTLDLYVSPEALFVPNAVSRLFAKIVRIEPDDVVFDIGTGTGVLAVWAAHEPSSVVYAVDPVREHALLARRNARLNGVGDKLRSFQGSLYEPLSADLRADVIIGDVSGIADGPGRALGWYASDVPTGGGDGTEVITDLLRQTHARLRPGGRLYFPVAVGLSDDEKIMSVARERFGRLEQKVDVWFPFTDEEYDLVACCLPSAFLSKLCKRGSRMAWNGHIYEATNPRAA
ncbi:MAG: 50S ribosomal protein L11 methyltransferase [Pirellulales bacterium]|nr:50S ribosomal protein L11 methyltransferase [Pirellulales bacterium]